MTDQEVKAAFKAVRARVDATGYGHWVGDDLVTSMVKAALSAAEKVRATPKPT